VFTPASALLLLLKELEAEATIDTSNHSYQEELLELLSSVAFLCDFSLITPEMQVVISRIFSLPRSDRGLQTAIDMILLQCLNKSCLIWSDAVKAF
jgi:hypothetical protein